MANPTEVLTPFQRGQTAASNGVPVNHCPFIKNSEKAGEWRDGYEKQKTAMLEAAK